LRNPKSQVVPDPGEPKVLITNMKKKRGKMKLRGRKLTHSKMCGSTYVIDFGS
jgi:hypothetical protein